MRSRPLLVVATLVALFSFIAFTGGEAALEPARRGHLILISIDTLRADRLACYGYERETSPHVDALARESVLFERVYAQSNNTAPSHMSLFTGLLPEVHQVLHTDESAEDGALPNRLPAGAPYLPALLQERGYHTRAFADGGYVSSAFGFDAGFDVFDSRYERVDEKIDRVETWLEGAPDEPTFLFVHTYGVHAPYLPSPEHDVYTDDAYRGQARARVERLRSQFEEDGEERRFTYGVMRQFWGPRELYDADDTRYIMDLYDGCIREVDAAVGRLLRALEAKGWLDEAWVVLTSDHGEAFREHGTFEHRQLFREELHVPLLIRPPGGLPETVRTSAVVRSMDVAPTALYALGLPRDPRMQGESLLPLERLADRPAFATSGGGEGDHAVVERPYKLLAKGRERTLFDIEEDPGELRNVAPERPTSWHALRALLRRQLAESARLREAVGDPEPGEGLPPETVRELEALGYFGHGDD